MTDSPDNAFSCPLPVTNPDCIRLGHGSGGSLTRKLLDEIIFPAFANPILQQGHDAAVLTSDSHRLAFTTDSYVVNPLFFPGGNIGELAVFGTINDLAMAGAQPRWLSCGLIIEEGLPLETLQTIVNAMGKAARDNNVQLVTGDIKVVERGKGDGLYINTSGVGTMPADITIAPARIQPGDAIILTGDLGRHGIAVMASRENLEFDTELTSDCAPLWEPVNQLLGGNINIHCLRDLTRGGLATALVELAGDSTLDFQIDESSIPVNDAVQGACELLGFDPLYVANEGRMVVFVPQAEVETALASLRQLPVTCESTVIGTVIDSVTDRTRGTVVMKTAIGTERLLDSLAGDQLPRIC